MRVSDLIPSRAALITRNYWNRQNHLVRTEPARPFANSSEGAIGNPAMDGASSGQGEFPGNQRQQVAAGKVAICSGIVIPTIPSSKTTILSRPG